MAGRPRPDFSRRPAAIVHDAGQAAAALRAALAANVSVLLVSPPRFAAYAGAGYFAAMIAKARDAVPAADAVSVLDCGDQAGRALEAIAGGVDAVVFTGRRAAADRLADIAQRSNCVLFRKRPTDAVEVAPNEDSEETFRRHFEHASK